MLECNTCHITLSDEDILKYNNICPCCHTQNSFCEEYIMDIKRISTDESFVNAMMELHEKDLIEYQLKLNQFKLQQEQSDVIKEQKRESNRTHCPFCNSSDVRKISGGERAASILGLGLLSKKINKSFKCSKCGGTF